MLAVVVALALVARVLSMADWAHTAALLGSVGPRLALVLLPFLVGMSLDTAAWGLVLRQIGSPVPFVPLLRMRLASEALTLSAPAGAVAAEAMKTVLLSRRHQIPAADGLASVAIKKVVYVLAHGLYLSVGLLAGRQAIRTMRAGLGPTVVTRWLPVFYGSVTAVMLGLGILLVYAWQRGGPAVLLVRAVGWLPSRRLRGWLSARAEPARALDQRARSFFTAGPAALGPVLGLLLCQWLTEAGETYLALRLLHVKVGVLPVIAFEALNSFARSIAFFVPAGLGVQELNQSLFCKAIGVPEPTAVAAALVVIKRSKDVVWTTAGYALLGRAWRTA